MATVILPTRNGAQAAYTFTFDDGGEGQHKHAVPILTALGLVGTFFLIGASVKSWYQGPQKQRRERAEAFAPPAQRRL